MTRQTRRAVLEAGTTALATAVAGCGGGTADEPADAGGLPQDVVVEMRSMPRIEFDPGIAHVAVGGTVTWTLHSGSHDTTAYHPDTKPPRRIPHGARPWESSVLSTVGETFECAVETPGVYDYLDTQAVCTQHVLVGAVGRVVVGWPDPADQPGLTEPQSDLPQLVKDKLETYNEETRALLAEGPDGTAGGDTDQ
jgi:plastocyanin